MCFSDVPRCFRVTSFHMITLQSLYPFIPRVYCTPLFTKHSTSPLICICETSGNAPVQFLLIVFYLPFSLIMNSVSELHNVNLGWCNLKVRFHSVFLSIFQAQAFKITAREKCAQGKPCTIAYVAGFHNYRSPVKNTLSWDQRTKTHLVVAKTRGLGLHHWG